MEIRRCQLNLAYSNAGKKTALAEVMVEAVRVVNLYIDLLWEAPKVKFVTQKVDSWLSARLQQCLGKQASEIVKSAKARLSRGRCTSKPVFRRSVINLDSRFVTFDRNAQTTSFDFWVRLASLGRGIKLALPTHKHKHFNAFVTDGWQLSKSARLRQVGNRFYLDVCFEKEVAATTSPGDKPVGVDCGYKRLLATSTGNIYGQELERVYEKLARQKRGSVNRQRTMQQRDNLVGKAVNQMLAAEQPTYVVLEALKNVKRGTRASRTMSRRFANKMASWVYSKTLQKIKDKCAAKGVGVQDVPAAYTSQTCSRCGNIDRSSRVGLAYRCVSCGYETDADTNAAVNILNRAVYSRSDNRTQNDEILSF